MAVRRVIECVMRALTRTFSSSLGTTIDTIKACSEGGVVIESGGTDMVPEIITYLLLPSPCSMLKSAIPLLHNKLL